MNRRAPERRVRARAVGHILVAQDEVRGASHHCLTFLCSFYAHRASTFAGRSGAPQRGVPFVPHHSSFLWDHAETFFQVAVVHAVGQRAGAAGAGAAYDMNNLGPSLSMCTATFVIVVEVMVRVIVTGKMDGDNHSPHRRFEELNNRQR